MGNGSSLRSLGQGRRARGAVVALVALLTAGLAILAGASGGAAAAPQADLSLTMSDNADPVFTRAALGYSIEVSNAGPDPAPRVVFTDRFPKGADFRSFNTSQGTCRLQKGVHRVICRLGQLESGSAPVRIAIHLRAPKAPGTISSTAFVKSAKSGIGDPDRANNRHTETTSVIARPAPPKCKGQRAGIVGTDADNVLNGDGANHVIVALGGNDQIFADGGNDLVCAGPGNDLVAGGPGSDRIYGGPENDQLRGEGGNDDVRGGPNGDLLKGGDGSDVLRGKRGRDVLKGKDGSDILRGGRGADILQGGPGDDLLIGGRGNDTCHGGPGNNTFLRC